MMKCLVTVCGIVSLAVLAGCGGETEALPELGTVTGKVTLDNQPLSDAMIFFEPSKGAMSSGSTDAQGEYVLHFNAETPGAVLGTHTVRISKPDGEAGPEILPTKYNMESELTAEVTAGDNPIDFQLTSK